MSKSNIREHKKVLEEMRQSGRYVYIDPDLDPLVGSKTPPQPVLVGTKSDQMKVLHDQGLSVKEIAIQVNAHYSFTYNVIKKYKESKNE